MFALLEMSFGRRNPLHIVSKNALFIVLFGPTLLVVLCRRIGSVDIVEKVMCLK